MRDVMKLVRGLILSLAGSTLGVFLLMGRNPSPLPADKQLVLVVMNGFFGIICALLAIALRASPPD